MRSTCSANKKIPFASASLRPSAFLGVAALAGLMLGQTSITFGQPQTPTGWSVSVLHNSVIAGVSETIYAGVSVSRESRAGYWRQTSGTFVDINPPGSLASRVQAVWGEVLAGAFAPTSDPSGLEHAALWTTPAPVIDLHPAGYARSIINATNGRQHVGWAQRSLSPFEPQIAMLWTGTSSAGVALPIPTDAKSAVATAVSTNQQGGTVESHESHAFLWNGGSGRFVDLHPSGAKWSAVTGMTDAYQAGLFTYESGPMHAALWFGSPESVRILSSAFSHLGGAASGPYQVGTIRAIGGDRATLWASTSSSAVNLHALLPVDYTSSWATSLWTDGKKIVIGGFAHTSNSDDVHAILWTYTPPAGAPTFTGVPQSITITAGNSFVLTANATATSAISFQWQREGADIPGATAATLVATQPGLYKVVATSGGSSTPSLPAFVSQLATSDVGRLSNFSIRTATGTDDQTLIVGAVIGGAGTKPVLARAAGPALSAYGLSGFLADPVLTVIRGGLVVAANDNWGGEQISSMTTAVGAFPLAAGSLDASVATSLSAGAYSFHVTGNGSASGLVLAELYDATPVGAFSANSPRLVNVSVRTRIATEARIAIAGFVIAGATAKTVLIRAIGPGLSALGVSGVLPDPKLELFSGSVLLYENDDWGGDALLAATSASVGAFPITNPSGKDAMLVMTLPPGSYTAQVSGVENMIGTVLVEIYEAL